MFIQFLFSFININVDGVYVIFFGVPVVAVISVVSDMLVIQVVVTATVVRVFWGLSGLRVAASEGLSESSV